MKSVKGYDVHGTMQILPQRLSLTISLRRSGAKPSLNVLRGPLIALLLLLPGVPWKSSNSVCVTGYFVSAANRLIRLMSCDARRSDYRLMEQARVLAR